MVWDLFVRWGHWLIVGLIAFQFYSGEELDLRDIHAWVGITLLIWVIFRLVWGFIGPQYARFSDFLGTPRQILNSFAELRRAKAIHKVGHTYAGGLGIVILMGLIGALSLTGLVTTDDIFYDAPLNHWVNSEIAGLATSIHHLLGKLLIATIVGHLVAIAWHQWRMKERLIQGMVHGRKPGGDQEFTLGTYGLGVAVLALVAGGVLAIIMTAGRM